MEFLVTLRLEVVEVTYRLLCERPVPVLGRVCGRAHGAELALTRQDGLPQGGDGALVLLELGQGGLQRPAGGLHLLAQLAQVPLDTPPELLDVLLLRHLLPQMNLKIEKVL